RHHWRRLETEKASFRPRLSLLLLLEERPDSDQVRSRGRRRGSFDRFALSGGQLAGARDVRHVRRPFRRPSGSATNPDVGRFSRPSASKGLSAGGDRHGCGHLSGGGAGGGRALAARSEWEGGVVRNRAKGEGRRAKGVPSRLSSPFAFRHSPFAREFS